MSKWIEERGKAVAAGEASSGAAAAPAATVVILRDGAHGLEVLLGRRSSKLAFHGGAWVFPGGRIDPEDYGDAPDDLASAARTAAVREAKEEAGVDVDPSKLVHFSNWTTPEIAPKRFATWFFAGPSEGGTEVADGAETEQLQWFRPEEALAARANGEIELAPPQYVTLLELRAHATVSDALAALRAAEVVDFTPRFYMIDGEGAICVYSDDVAYHDAGRLNANGPRHRLYLREGGWDYVRD
jgi:8-oxo-dGTP pyrophosphatase MutT (NUDIX family)